jgi:hypothetical protein
MLVDQASFCRYGVGKALHKEARRSPASFALSVAAPKTRRRGAPDFRLAHCMPLSCCCHNCRLLYTPGIGDSLPANEPAASAAAHEKRTRPRKGQARAVPEHGSADGPEKTSVLVYDSATHAYQRKLQGELSTEIPVDLPNCQSLRPPKILLALPF